MPKNQYENNITMSSIHKFNNSNPNNNGNNAGANTANVNNNQQNIPLMINVNPPSDDNGSDVEELLINYNEIAQYGGFQEAFFRDAQIMQLLTILNTKKHPNAIMTGDAGVGKTQIVEEIARRLVNNDPIISTLLKDVTIYELQISSIVAGSKLLGQYEEKIKNVIAFAEDPNNKALIFIDEIHQLFSGNSEVYQQIAQILKPALARGKMRVIGATTTQESKKLMDDPAFNRRFSTVNVPELTPEETTQIVYHLKSNFEQYHNVILPDHVIDQAVAIGDEYKQYGSHRPDSTLTVIDKAMASMKIKRIELIEQAKTDPIMQTIINAQPIPVLTIKQLENAAKSLVLSTTKLYDMATISKLKDQLDENIINQDTAKSEMVDAVQRLATRVTKRKRPTSFLMVGPSGTGKTETAKQVAESLFGSKDHMIYINMSEYNNPSALTRITGSTPGYVGSESKRELPFDALQTMPYQVIVLDEFEKAHEDVQLFFMQALDEGKVMDAKNKEIDFSRTIIIATTNAGIDVINAPHMGFIKPEITQGEIKNALAQTFKKELINRFEHIISFNEISKEDYTKILGVKYNQLIQEAIKSRTDLSFSPDYISPEDAIQNDVLKALADKTYDKMANGRPAEKTIRNFLEDTLIANPNQTQFDLL